MCIHKFIVIFIVIVIFSVVGYIMGPRSEAKRFNGGVCPLCGEKFRYFDTDSQGGRGYTCDNCMYTTWVSYNRVDRHFREKEGLWYA